MEEASLSLMEQASLSLMEQASLSLSDSAGGLTLSTGAGLSTGATRWYDSDSAGRLSRFLSLSLSLIV